MSLVETKPVLRSAQVMRFVLLVIFGGICVIAAGLQGLLISDHAALGRALADMAGYDVVAPRLWQSGALVLITLLHLAIWAAIAWRGQGMFDALLDADMAQASDAARRVARLLWAMLIWGILSHMLVSLVATWHFPPGQRALAVGVGSAQISTVMAALLATFTSHAFVLGAALWQDHREVI
ncbi:MAG: hypothetical protein AAFY65_06210 [Pseudomonadota bacterium]